MIENKGRFSLTLAMALCACGSPVANIANTTANAAENMAASPVISNASTPVATSGLSKAEISEIAAASKRGEDWFYRDDGDAPGAMFGPPESDASLILACANANLHFSVMWVEPQPGLERVTIKSSSGNAQVSTKFEGELVPSLVFDVPLNNPALGGIVDSGFIISFPNGERDSFPSGAALTKVVAACRRRGMSKPVATGGDWSGEYAGRFDGGSGSTTFRAAGSQSNYRIETSVTNPQGCSGTVEGTAVAKGNTFDLVVPIPDPAVGGTCTMTYAKNGTRLSVKEGPGCSYFHGASCAFDGTLTKK